MSNLFSIKIIIKIVGLIDDQHFSSGFLQHRVRFLLRLADHGADEIRRSRNDDVTDRQEVELKETQTININKFKNLNFIINNYFHRKGFLL